ncbi:lysis protein [Photorhabdus heterorhabditis]|uniref:lysis protein n=1 Tax=Photorhabdus heterorhabditis TaxID=880156 RepID=UPI001BD1CE8C|nr:lysis protein [Photorhabdus heterorhabditis]MBS9442268.1 lysis protein [Photorhabdus heterorhabditis]
MKFNSHSYTIIALALVSLLAYHYYGQYTKQLDATVQLQSRLLEQQNEIVSQQERIKRLSELDTKHTQELTNAKSEIDTLRDDVASGRKRLFVKATCPKSEADSRARMDDAATARPADTAIRNYWTLRERIAAINQQVLGLQDYIKTQCQ